MSEQSEVLMLTSQSQVQECLEVMEHGQEESEESPGSKEPSTSDEEAGPVTMRKRTKNFSDSESDFEREPRKEEENRNIKDVTSLTESEDIVHDSSSSIKRTKKSRIKQIETSESENSSSEDVKTQKKSVRAEDKMKKLKEKFRGLISNHIKSSQGTDTLSDLKPTSDVETSEKSDEEVSCLKIKEKIKKSVYSMNSICDPDTSDEESNLKPMLKQRKKQPKARSTKPTSPKPIRMSAKQAMENMHKIKSESNRMLREKQVSLPYHRPKALSLKDILSRRKPAVTSDGKALPIKMNNEQLKQYALLLEQRQKEVIELCKSDSEEEEEDCPEVEAIVKNDISTDTTTNVLTEQSLEGINIQQISEQDRGNFNEISCIETNAQENILNLNSVFDKQTESSMQTESVNDSANMDVDKENETDINNSDVEQRLDIILEDLSDNQIINESEKNTQRDSQKETASMDLDKENGTEVTTNPRNNKEQRTDITEEMSEKQTVDIANQKTVINSKNEESANMDFNKKDEIDINNIPKSDKEQRTDIVSKELSETQIFNASEQNTERDSQNMELHYDSEKVELFIEGDDNKGKKSIAEVSTTTSIEKQHTETLQSDDDEFLDNDFNYDEIDKLIENAKIANDGSQKHVSNPKLTGAPGMVIDLDDTDSLASKHLTGVDLLKERFSYFAKLKSLEDMEKDREKKFKPGVQHLKLKQELEEQIAEQRSNEWEKRLEEEKRLKSEINDHYSDDDIEKLEAKLEEGCENVDEEKVESESSAGEEEPIENDIILEDKPKNRNPMADDEAEESECDEEIAEDGVDETDDKMSKGEVDDGEEADLDDDDTSDTSSESEDEVETKPRKGRILKAFEDSDEESPEVETTLNNKEVNSEITEKITNVATSKKLENDLAIKDSQDDELQLAQANKSSEELFSTQESDKPNPVVAALNKDNADNTSADLGTQTFSILDSLRANQTLDLKSQEKTPICRTQTIGDDLNLLVGVYTDKFPDNFVPTQNAPPQFSQTQEIGDDVVALCTGQFYDNPFLSQDKLEKNFSPLKLTEGSQSQEFGDDIAALCTGKFYDNPFVSQYGDNSDINKTETLNTTEKPNVDTTRTSNDNELVNSNNDKEQEIIPKHAEKTILNSILEELDGPDFQEPKNKYFVSDTQSDKNNVEHSQVKKKFVIDSDDETNDGTSKKKNKKLRKRKAEERALQISDEEDEEEELAEDPSDIESDINEDEDRIVEYDSEENEVEVQQKTSEKKRVGAFFENEAELTSEDEWVGSGDEDERGLDRMEREEGDDDTFHQGRLQRELEQIHMREVLDQDKREVRMIQELLFEDGDLGDGHRQRKFRWRTADGEEEIGTNPDELLDTHEEEFESEEQWRKQRHEREMFLRKLQEKDEEELDTSVKRTAIIKANLCSRSMSMLLSATKNNKIKGEDGEIVAEKKIAKDIPSPKKPFMIFQQNYHGSLLTRGRGALARLAALATPLATDDGDAPKAVTTANRRNFVFTALSQDHQPKVTKRKADTNVNTPRLIKKMKTEDPNKLRHYKNSLFDHLKS